MEHPEVINEHCIGKVRIPKKYLDTFDRPYLQVIFSHFFPIRCEYDPEYDVIEYTGYSRYFNNIRNYERIPEYRFEVVTDENFYVKLSKVRKVSDHISKNLKELEKATFDEVEKHGGVDDQVKEEVEKDYYIGDEFHETIQSIPNHNTD